MPTSVEERRGDPMRARPLLVFVHDDPDRCEGDCDGACERTFEVDEEVFGQEKVALGSRAFRTVWMTSAEAEAEPLLGKASTGELPRLVFLDVARDNVSVLQGSQLAASRTYAEMKRTAAKFYEERLDSVVKRHLKILLELDKLSNEERRLQEQLTLTSDERRADRMKDELDELRDEVRDLQREVEGLWKLTLEEL